MNNFQDENKPIVVIFAEPGGLSLSLLENLLLNLCKVVVVSDNLPEWFKKVEHVNERDSIKFASYETISLETLTPNYIIFVSNSVEPSDSFSSQKERAGVAFASAVAEKFLANIVFVFPYNIYPDLDQEVLKIAEDFSIRHSDHSGILFVGDLVGPRVNFTERRILSRLSKDIAEGRDIRLPKYNFEIHPLYIKDAAKEIIKNLFSFGGVGEKVALISPVASLSVIYDSLNKASSNLNFAYTDETLRFPNFGSLSTKMSLPINFGDVFAEIVNWYLPQTGLIISSEEAPVVLPKINLEERAELNINAKSILKSIRGRLPKREKGRKLSFKRRHKLAMITFFLIIIAPYLNLLFGGVLLFVVRGQLISGNTSSASVINNVAHSVLNFSYVQSDMFVKVPLVGKIYENSKSLSEAGKSASQLVGRAVKVVDIGTGVVEKVLTGNGKDIADLSRDLSLETDAIYRELSFLESDLEADNGAVGYFANKLYSNFPLREIRDKISYASSLAKSLPDLLGADGRKTYMIVFQNNMELRPAGGFIGSFALVTFEKGKLTGFDVYDVYDADGQLKGHIEPPAPIKKYLGEAGWYLRDSNWDPDFTVSAQRAEWFLDKELDVDVDGVASVDLDFVKKLVDVFGTLEIKDFGKTVDSHNLYQVTQDAAEEDFFPGSRNKSSFLTALTKELLDRITNIKKSQLADTLRAVYQSLEARHVQLYSHDQSVQSAISDFGWDGSILPSTCSENCYNDFLAMAEANLGVNKANYYVTRSMEGNVTIGPSLITRQVTLTLKNSAPLSMGSDGSYKTYVRVLVPSDAAFLAADIKSSITSKKIDPDVTDVRGRKEAGLFVEVPPQSEATVVFRWNTNSSLNFNQSGFYNLLWRKQSGTNDDPIKVHINAPANTKSNSALTVRGQTSYNTTLERDFRSRIYW